MSNSASEMTQERSLFEIIFLSPDERRLRAGWRLLGHTLGLLLALIILGLITTLIAAIFSGGIDGEALLETLNPVLFALSSLLAAVVVTLVTWIARRVMDRRSLVSLGLARDTYWLPDLLFGIGLGGLLMGLIYALHAVAGWLTFEGWVWQTQPNWWLGLLGAFVAFVGVGYYEELLSRGYHLQNLADGLGMPLALIISSALFSLLHFLNPGADVASALGIFLAGLFLAYGWLRTRQLWIPIGLHIGWNFFQGTVFGFPVSGTGGFHLIEQSVDGPALITGGAFGPEAGLSGWAAILLGTALIFLYTRNRTIAAATDSSNTQD